MTTTDPRAWLAELTDHLTGMADSLDDHVTHEDVHRLLMEARQLSLQRDAALTAVLDLHGHRYNTGDCAECEHRPPCPTVRAITEQLTKEDRHG